MSASRKTAFSKRELLSLGGFRLDGAIALPPLIVWRCCRVEKGRAAFSPSDLNHSHPCAIAGRNVPSVVAHILSYSTTFPGYLGEGATDLPELIRTRCTADDRRYYSYLTRTISHLLLGNYILR